MTKILDQARRDLVGLREFQRRGRLQLMDAETSGAPVDDLQLQLADLAPPEAVSRHEQEHRVIATPENGRSRRESA
jgi:hypothetical protein